MAERIAVAFEKVDDVASIIVDYANSLSTALQVIEARLVALLEATEDIPKNRIRRMNATMALVAIGNRSPSLLASADAIVERELRSPVAYTRNSVGRLAWVEEPAIISKCLPPQRREELAMHYLHRALDEQDIEANRASYAVAFVHLAPDLSQNVCNRVFDGLLPLAQGPMAATNAFDIMEARFRNPRSWFRVTGPTDRLRRSTLKALAVLATDAQRQHQVWRAAQRLIVSGRRSDSVAAADTAFRLSKAGFAPNLPWQSMVYSADVEMRQLAAALLPFLPSLDFDAIGSLASDSVTNVRTDLAIALRKLMNRSDLSSQDREELSDVVQTLRDDSSYRVRSELPEAASRSD
ncbi:MULTISPECIES: hypothetical protein [unclassified Mycobacterium]|uniref:hypothetical protein n=1 Tax=unclassified Mycobacterium TaxID=2642494 RepID=UPI000A87B476|nr:MULTISPECIES: hypothetical protein [unclassified Mycobacterium]